MATIESASAGEFDAVSLINTAVEENDSSSALINDLERRQDMLEGEERALVRQYIVGIRPQINNVLVKDLGETVGGMYDGSDITMGKSSLYVYTGVEQTVDRVEETRGHEDYHAEHEHTASMIAGSSAAGETIVTIGGHSFDDEALIEGITVAQTGDTFVSDEYRRFKSDVLMAIASAGIEISDVEEAIRNKDLRGIDDADRASQQPID